MDAYAEAREDPGTGGKRVDEEEGPLGDEEEETDQTEQKKTHQPTLAERR